MTTTRYVSPLDERAPSVDPLAPRPAELTGMRAVLLDIRKNRGDEFLDRIEELLRARDIPTTRLSKEIFSKPASPEVIAKVGDRGDLVIEGLAD